MLSSANYFEGGNYVWFVGHNAQEGIFDLQTEGILPTQFDTIKSRLVDQQNAEGGEVADVDFIFDVPLELAKSICGFKHDSAVFEWGEPEFFVAEQTIEEADLPKLVDGHRSWLSRLFAKRT